MINVFWVFFFLGQTMKQTSWIKVAILISLFAVSSCRGILYSVWFWYGARQITMCPFLWVAILNWSWWVAVCIFWCEVWTLLTEILQKASWILVVWASCDSNTLSRLHSRLCTGVDCVTWVWTPLMGCGINNAFTMKLHTFLHYYSGQSNISIGWCEWTCSVVFSLGMQTG